MIVKKVIVLSIAIIVGLSVAIFKFDKSITGTWRSESSGIIIQFDDNWCDNIYTSSKEFYIQKETIELEMPDGSTQSTGYNISDGVLKLDIFDGQEFYRLNDIPVGKYKPQHIYKSQFKSTTSLDAITLYSDCTAEHSGVDSISKYFLRGNTITFLDEDENIVFTAFISNDKYIGLRKTDASISSITEHKVNAIKSEGYRLDCQIINKESNEAYVFTLDGVCTYLAADSTVTSGFYSVNSEGLIETEWNTFLLDLESNSIYSDVFILGSWNEFLNGSESTGINRVYNLS